MHLFPVKDNSWLFLESTSFNQNVFISFHTDADTVCIIQHILFGPQDQSVKICVIFEVQHLVAGQSHKEGSHSRQIHPYPVLDCIQRKQKTSDIRTHIDFGASPIVDNKLQAAVQLWILFCRSTRNVSHEKLERKWRQTLSNSSPSLSTCH